MAGPGEWSRGVNVKRTDRCKQRGRRRRSAGACSVKGRRRLALQQPVWLARSPGSFGLSGRGTPALEWREESGCEQAPGGP